MADKADFEVELVDGVSRPAKKASTSIQRLQHMVSRFRGSSLGRVGSQLMSIGRTAVIAGTTVGAALSGGFTAATVGMADFVQRSNQAFKLLAKNGEVPEQLFQRSIDLAAHLGLNIKDTTKQIQKFRALQFTQGQSEALIKMGADMQALGASGEEVSRIFAQLGQIKAKGRLQGEELTTLAESGVSTQVVLAALSKQMGKTTSDIQKMLSAGKIDSTNALNAIGTAILFKTGTKQFGEAGRQMAESTLSGMAGLLKSGAQKMLLSVARSAMPEIESAGKAVFEMFDGFMGSRRGATLVTQLGDAMAFVARSVERAVPFVKEFFGGFDKGFAEDFEMFSAGFKSLFSTLSGDGKSGLAIARALGVTVGHLTVAFGALAIGVGAVAAAFTVLSSTGHHILRAVLGAIGIQIGNIIGAVRDFWSTLSTLWHAEGMSLGEKSYEIGKHVVLGLVRGMKELWFLPASTMHSMVGHTILAAKDALGIQSPSKVFEGIGKNTALGFAQGLSSLPAMSVIHSTLGNDNGMRSLPSMAVDPIMPAPVRGNLGPAPVASGASGGRMGNVSITNNINISGSTATPEERAQLADDIEQRIFDGVHNYFGGMAFEKAV